MQFVRKALAIFACSLSLAGFAYADVLETTNYSAFNPSDVIPGDDYGYGYAPSGWATVVGLIPGPTGVDSQWVTQEITLSSSASLSSLTIASQNFSDELTLTIGGQSFTVSSAQNFSSAIGENYAYHTFDLSGLSVSSTFSVTVTGSFSFLNLADQSHYDPSIKNASIDGTEISWDDWNNNVDNKVPYSVPAAAALQFSLNYTPAAAVPEPETYLMMLSGVALLSGVAVRRKRKATALAA